MAWLQSFLLERDGSIPITTRPESNFNPSLQTDHETSDNYPSSQCAPRVTILVLYQLTSDPSIIGQCKRLFVLFFRALTETAYDQNQKKGKQEKDVFFKLNLLAVQCEYIRTKPPRMIGRK